MLIARMVTSFTRAARTPSGPATWARGRVGCLLSLPESVSFQAGPGESALRDRLASIAFKVTPMAVRLTTVKNLVLPNRDTRLQMQRIRHACKFFDAIHANSADTNHGGISTGEAHQKGTGESHATAAPSWPVAVCHAGKHQQGRGTAAPHSHADEQARNPLLFRKPPSCTTSPSLICPAGSSR